MSVLASRSAERRAGAPRPDHVHKTIALPNGALCRRRYDFLGRLLREDRPDGSWLDYRYAPGGRLESVVHSSGERVTYDFDPQQREWRTGNGRVETVIRLSADDYPVEIVTRIDGHVWSIGYQRDTQGRLTAIHYPQSRDWTYFDRSGQDALEICCADQIYCHVEGDADVGRTTVRYANGSESVERLQWGSPARLAHLIARSATGATALDQRFSYGSDGRIAQLGARRAAYDAAGRLTGWNTPDEPWSYAYDERGRFQASRRSDHERVFRYADAPTVAAYDDSTAGTVRFDYDPLGRRTLRHAAEGATRYAYDLIGQLAHVELPDGRTIHYLYDGFGRLVGREVDGDVVYYLVDLDGHRLAEAAADGRITASYLWLGPQCVGRIDGVMGDPLAQTYYRGHGGRLAAVGDAVGAVRPIPGVDPFGADAPIDAGVPGYAGLFGDPLTGLLHAGARWLDPAIAQFLTPDSWFGEDIGRRMPPPLRRVLDARPGGTARIFTPETAYNWCAYDPLNFSDPNGHNWLGLFFSTISALLWEMQLTSVSLQMQVINFILDTIMVFPIFRPVWDTDGYWHTSVYNTAFPVASYRLMVPFAFIMNGLLNVQDVAWTLGSVIWARGSEFRKLESQGKRDLLICSNAPDYVASREAVAADRPPERDTLFRGGGTVSANGRRIAGASVLTPPGLALADLFQVGDNIAVWPVAGGAGKFARATAVGADQIDFASALPDNFRNQPVELGTQDRLVTVFRVRNPRARGSGTAAGATSQVTGATATSGALADIFAPEDLIAIRPVDGTADELRRITTIAGDRIDLDEPLPAGFVGAVELARLDRPVVKIERDSQVIARLISFIRGQALHFATQIPESFPTEQLAVAEFLTTGAARAAKAAFPAERILLRMAQTADLDGYAAGDFVRVSAAGFSAHRVERPRPPRDLLLDTPLPGSPARVEVTRMTADGAAAPNQRTTTAARDRVTTGALTGLTLDDGLQIESPGPNATMERRIATRLFLDCEIDAVPNALQAAPITVEQLAVEIDPAKRATGQVGSPTTIATEPDHAARLSAGTSVRVANAADQHAYGVVAAVDAPNNLITLRDDLPAAGFDAGTAVTVAPLNPAGTLVADDIAPPGDHLVVQAPRADAVANGAVVRIRPTADPNAGVVRVVRAAPALLAGLDRPLPASHATGLSIQRFVPDAGSRRTGATAPPVRRRLILTGAATNPFAVNDTIFLDANEETIGIVERVSGMEIVLQDPVGLPIRGPVQVYGIAPTGVQTAGARLDEGMVLVPSDMDVTLTRREALENHEMRHVLQGAIWGPFLLSLPLPWLFDLGFSGSDLAQNASEITRHIGLGGIDSLFALIFSGFETGGIDLAGHVSADRRTLRLAADAGADQVDAFSQGSPITISKGDFKTLNFVDTLNTTDKTILLRFALDTARFAADDEIKASVSRFEKTRRIVNTWFSLNLERLWSDHIPVAWGRALSRLLNRDSWFPLIGLYPLSWMFAGGDRERIPNEQDASYYSGDLYNTIVLSPAPQIFVGQFARIFAFINARGGTSDAAGLSKNSAGNLHEILKVELPEDVDGDGDVDADDAQPAAIAAAVAAIPGATRVSGTRQVRFRENWQIPLADKAENAVGAFFASARPGTYTLRAPGTLAKDLVFKFAFSVSFTELSKVEVIPLLVVPNIAQPIEVFETETTTFAITTGDTTAEYSLRYPVGSATELGTIEGLRFTAPELGAAAPLAVQMLELTATYPEDHPVFKGAGQPGAARLTAEQRTNRCHEPFPVTIRELTAPAIGPVAAGSTTDFTMPIAPVSTRVDLPPGASGHSEVLNLGGRPAQLKFVAPTVTAPVDVTFDMTFGAELFHRKTITTTVRVEPAP